MKRQRGNSLVEVLAVVAAVGAVIGIGLVTFHNLRLQTHEHSLEQDVASLNRAVGVYLLSGGSLDGAATAQDVIAKLKSVAGSEQAEQINGFRGSMLDLRLKPVEQSEEEGDSKDLRVLWDNARKRFELARSGGPGIKSFKMDDKGEGEKGLMPLLAENRLPSMKLATVDEWVWDYDSSAAGEPRSITYLGAGGSYTGPGGFAPPAPAPLVLAPPTPSIDGGIHPLKDFNMSVTLDNPNPQGVSKVIYSLNGSEWFDYQPGDAIDVGLGTEIQAVSVSIDPDNWMTSDPESNIYDADPVTLALGVDAPQDAYRFDEVGGEMIEPALAPLGSAPSPVTVSLLNVDELPGFVFDGENPPFLVHYVYDGSDPRSSESRFTVSPDASTHSFGIDIGLAQWGSQSSLPIGVVGVSNGFEYIRDSEVMSKVLGINPISLRAPESSVPGGTYTTNQSIEFSVDAQYGDLPKGARVFYTTDGSDPLDSNGKPKEGAVELVADVMNGVFGEDESLPVATSVAAFDGARNPRTIVARATGPEGYEHWFTPSDPVELAFEPYNVEEWDGYIVGDFGTRETKAFRNIKQNIHAGPLDETFDPGIGFDAPVKDIAIDSDMSAVVVGAFTTYNGESVGRITRIAPDGKRIRLADKGDGFDGVVECVYIQGDGSILVGGDFTTYSDNTGTYSVGRVAKLSKTGKLDTSFNDKIGDGFDAPVYAITRDTEGHILVGGAFTSITAMDSGVMTTHSSPGIIRLESNGDIDDGFDVAEGVGGIVYDIGIQKLEPNRNKIVIVGDFSSYRGVNRNNVARINRDGSHDPMFDPKRGPSKEVYTVSIFPQTDKVFIGGRFTHVDQKIRKGVAVLTANGMRDDNWNIGNGNAIPSWRIYDSAITASGKVVIGGRLIAYNPNSRPAFKMLNQDGTIDEMFHPEDIPQNSIIYAVAIRDQGGAIVLGGDFDHEAMINGHSDIAKLDPTTGARDTAFDVGSGTNANAHVNTVAKDANGNLIVGGNFLTIQGYTRNRLARLNPDGSLDLAFRPDISRGSDGYVKINFDDPEFQHGSMIASDYYEEFGILISVANADPAIPLIFDTNQAETADPDLESPWSGGNIEDVGFGLYTDFGNALVIADNIIDIDPADGIVDDPSDSERGGTVTFSLTRDDVVGFQATFIDFDDVSDYSISLWGPDEMNVTFASFMSEFLADGSDNPLYDGTIVQGDNFVNILPTMMSQDLGLGNLERIDFHLMGAGALDDLYFITDANFNPRDIKPAEVHAVAVQQDGKILVGGDFAQVNGSTHRHLVRLNPDGSVDSSFGTGSGFDGPVRSIAIDEDGMIVVGGRFSSYNGEPAAGLVRLYPENGLRDASVQAIAGTTVHGVRILPDGCICYVGSFSSPSGGVAILNGDGSTVDGFNSGLGTGTVYSLDLQSDGCLVIGGAFESYDGHPVSKVARLHPDGTLDTSFDCSSSVPDGVVSKVRVLPEGGVVIAGDFDNCGANVRDGIAKLTSTGSLDFSFEHTELDINYVSDTR